MQQPMRLSPAAVARPWGGARFGSLPEGPIGELWITGDEARLADGRTLAEAGMAEDVPLVKLLDVGGRLSVQVHPDDALARELAGPDAVGKHEMWVVLEASDDAQLFVGLAPAASADALYSGDSDAVLAALRRVRPAPGSAIDVPPGTVHTPGAGLVLYEVQQRSDITYRIWDWGRDRPIHVEESRHALRPLVAPEPIPGTDGPGRWTLSDRAAPFLVERVRVDAAPVVLSLGRPAVVSVVAGEPELGVPEASGSGEVDEVGPLETGSHWIVPAGTWTLGGRGEALIASNLR